MNITNKSVRKITNTRLEGGESLGNPKSISLEMIWYMRNLHDKYGEDVVKMFRDGKLNYLQYSKTKLQTLLKQYLENEIKLRVEEEVGNIDEFDGRTNADKELENLEEELRELGIDDISSDEEIEQRILAECGIPDISFDNSNENEEDEDEEEQMDEDDNSNDNEDDSDEEEMEEDDNEDSESEESNNESEEEEQMDEDSESEESNNESEEEEKKRKENEKEKKPKLNKYKKVNKLLQLKKKMGKK